MSAKVNFLGVSGLMGVVVAEAVVVVGVVVVVVVVFAGVVSAPSSDTFFLSGVVVVALGAFSTPVASCCLRVVSAVLSSFGAFSILSPCLTLVVESAVGGSAVFSSVVFAGVSALLSGGLLAAAGGLLLLVAVSSFASLVDNVVVDSATCRTFFSTDGSGVFSGVVVVSDAVF